MQICLKIWQIKNSKISWRFGNLVRAGEFFHFSKFPLVSLIFPQYAGKEKPKPLKGYQEPLQEVPRVAAPNGD